jgi:hypothetical protein
MADYYSPTVVQQTIAEADITPLERLLLSHIFESERDGEGWYFFSESGPADMIVVEHAALMAALATSELDIDNTANSFVRKLLAGLTNGELKETHLDLDLSETSWGSSFRISWGVHRRSNTCRRGRRSHVHGCVLTASAAPPS